MKLKIRLDQTLVDKGLVPSLKKARAVIGAGEVHVDDILIDKPGQKISPQCVIRLKKKCQYVSRGGLKLEKGLASFDISLENKTCIDIGASSGGFTDCLLQHGARKVYAVDVAYGQLAWKIRQDDRVVVFERFNARKICRADINEPVDLAVIDASFISITKLIPPLLPLFTDNIAILTLIKPQFELPKREVGAGGVVRDPALHSKAIETIELFTQSLELKAQACIESPILGPKGNKEFLMLITSMAAPELTICNST